MIEDLHLDSLAMVQLQSTLETRFGMELDDAVWEQVRTVGDLRGLLQPPSTWCGCRWGGFPRQSPAHRPKRRRHRSCRSQPEARSGLSPLALVAGWSAWCVSAFSKLVVRPLVWLVLAPRIAPPVDLARPSLLIANHLTAFDVPVILYALRAAIVTMWRWPCRASC